MPRPREDRVKLSPSGPLTFPAPTAQVQAGIAHATLNAPQGPQTRQRPTIKVWAVDLVETHQPKGATAVHWLLLTVILIASVKQVLKRVRYCCRRWRIEQGHLVMERGCHILENQSRKARVLLRAIALDAVIAFAVLGQAKNWPQSRRQLWHWYNTSYAPIRRQIILPQTFRKCSSFYPTVNQRVMVGSCTSNEMSFNVKRRLLPFS